MVYAGALDELIGDVEIETSRRVELNILEKEKEELGIYVTNHPVLGIWDVIKNKTTHEIIDLQDAQAGTAVKLGGIMLYLIDSV